MTTDTISWPKDFLELKKLDNLMRCGICYDYMKLSMMTSCSHNYCSLCIRKYMQYKSVCPTCFEETFEVSLRNNRPLDEIILLFTKIRDKLIRHLRLAAIHEPKLEELEDKTTTAPVSPTLSNKSFEKTSASKLFKFDELNLKDKQTNHTNSKEKCVARRLDNAIITSNDDNDVTLLKSPASGQSPATSSLSTNDKITPAKKIPSIFYSPKKAATSASPSVSSAVPTVNCPVCNVDIPERNINIHLDNCLARENSPTKRNTKVSKRSPIPKRVYSMMSEKDLRKWLKTYGLSSIGEKKSLISRIQRYTVLYNSECDSENPRSAGDLIKQVEKEEKDEKLATSSFLVVRKPINRNTDKKVIDEENKKYIEKNKASFESLINAMRERDQQYIKPTKVVNRISEMYDSDSDDEIRFVETVPIDEKYNDANGYEDECFQSALEPEVIIKNGIADYEYNVQSPELCGSTVEVNKATHFDGCTESTVDSKNDLVIGSTSPLGSGRNKSTFQSPRTKCELYMDDIYDCKDEFTDKQQENHSDDSNESISLLNNFSYPIAETVTKNEAMGENVTESQMIDPDFTVTDTELNNCDDSEDVFVKRSKRKQPSSLDRCLPKRQLRKRTK